MICGGGRCLMTTSMKSITALLWVHNLPQVLKYSPKSYTVFNRWWHTTYTSLISHYILYVETSIGRSANASETSNSFQAASVICLDDNKMQHQKIFQVTGFIYLLIQTAFEIPSKIVWSRPWMKHENDPSVKPCKPAVRLSKEKI